MDVYSLAAAHSFHVEARQAPMTARAEDHYYASQLTWPRLGYGLLGSITGMAGIILFLGTSLI